jgi:hypothetical protein
MSAREQFERRRAAGRIAELLAQAVGRGCTEAGTARIAIKLALESNAMREAKRRGVTGGTNGVADEGDSPAAPKQPGRSGDETGRPTDTRRAIMIRGRGGKLNPSGGV